MKLLLFILLCFTTGVVCAQIRPLGSKKETVIAPGRLGADSAIVFPKDTVALTSTQRSLAFKGTLVYKWDGGKWTLLVKSDTTFVQSPLMWNAADSTLSLKVDSLPQLAYKSATRDTTLWKDTTLIDKGYLNDRIAGFSGGGTTSIQTYTLSSGSKIATFTSVPTTYADYEIYRWGVRLYPVTDYTTSGNDVTILDGEDGEPITFQRIK